MSDLTSSVADDSPNKSKSSFTTQKSTKSWKQTASSADATLTKKSAAQLEHEERQQADRAARRQEEQQRMQQVNASIAADLLGGFQISDADGQRHVPSQDIAGLDFMSNNDNTSKQNITSSAAAAATATANNNNATARPLTDTISEYPLINDEQFEEFATSIATRLLSIKLGSQQQQSQRLLKFTRTLTKRLSDNMRVDEINLLKGHVTVLHTDKSKSSAKRVVGGKAAAATTLNVKSSGKGKSSAARNTYHDDEDDDDDGFIEDDRYQAEDDFM